MIHSTAPYLVLLSAAVALGTGSAAHAQVPSILLSSFEVAGSVSHSGDYGAAISAPGQEFLDRAGTYQADVSFTASVTVSGANLLAQSGSFEASGPFSATVSAPDVDPFVVGGTYTGAGAFTASERGPFAVQGPFGGSGSFTTGGLSMSYGNAIETTALTDMIAQLGGLGAFAPVAAVALEVEQPPGGSSTAGTPNVTVALQPGGFTAIQSGTSDLAALIAAQPFELRTVWKLDVALQSWLVFVVGAPPFLNTPTSLAPTDIVWLISK
ncbi:MAG TPA: hypothetical protein QGI71_09015 [Dehalococcoidia bacterium]|jgi:hypothetical protein|nr:hypothetical protein [Dehalococcoidia bacterium]